MKQMRLNRLAACILFSLGFLYVLFWAVVLQFHGPVDDFWLGILVQVSDLKGPYNIFFIFSLFALILWNWGAGFKTDDIPLVTKTRTLSPRIGMLLCLLITVAAAVLLCCLKLEQYRLLQTSSFDHGIFANIWWNRLHTGTSWSYIDSRNFLAVHFSLVHLAASYLLHIWNNAAVMLALQSLVMVAAAPAVYLLARKLLDDIPAALLLVLFFLTNQYFHTISRFDYHPVSLAVPILLWLLYGLQEKKWLLFFILAAVALLIKENIPLALAGLGFFMLFRSEWRKPGAVLLVLSLIYFGVVMKIIMPQFLEPGAPAFHVGRYAQYGSSSEEIIVNVLSDPMLLINHTILVPEKLIRVLNLLDSFGFLPIVGGFFSLPALPLILLNMASKYPGQWKIAFQYSASIIPFLIFGSIYGLSRVKARIETPWGRTRSMALIYAVLALLIVRNLLMMPTYINPVTDTAHIRAFHRIKNTIPPDASVCAQNALTPHLAMRHTLYLFGYQNRPNVPGCKDADVVVLDLAGSIWPFETRQDYLNAVTKVLRSKKFGVTEFDSGIVVLEEGRPLDKNQAILQKLDQYRGQ